MGDHIRRRLACDRCHSQKLKCPRRPGVAVCDRCLKTKKSCAYSPFRQKKISQDGKAIASSASAQALTVVGGSSDHETPSGINSRAPPELQLEELATNLIDETPSDQIDPAFTDGMSLDYPYPALEEFDANDSFPELNIEIPSEYTPFNSDPMSNFYRPETTPKVSSFPRLRSPIPPTPPKAQLLHHYLTVDPEFTVFQNIPLAVGWQLQPGQVVNLETASECVQRLSQLSTKLYDHSKTIPPMSIHDPVTPGENLEAITALAAGFQLEDSLSLTQQMIDVYPSVINMSCHNQDDGSAREGEKPPLVDYAFLLLAFSCHLRLVEIYEKLYQHSIKCIESHGKPLNKKQAACVVPAIKIGSFQPPPTSAVPLQMFLLLHLASQLSNHSTDLVRQLKGIKSKEQTCGGNADSSNRVVLDAALGAAEDVEGKANYMTMQVNTMRNKMLNAGLLA